MKNKKLLIAIISVAFAVVVLCLAVSVFTVKQVKVHFSFSANKINESEVEEKANAFVGKNLMFLNIEEVERVLSENPFIEVLSVEKNFPNVINVSVKERREVYLIEYHGKTYVTDMNGLVLCEKNADEQYGEHELIELSLDNIFITELTIGEYFSTDADAFLKNAFEIAKSVNLTDSVRKMTVENRFSGENNSYITFETYSGVDIVINKAEINGLAKSQKAFQIYDAETDDYVKSFDVIDVFETNEGIIEAVWGTKKY